MNPENVSKRAASWRLVIGLAILQAAIVFTYSIYNFYQPKILTLLGAFTLIQLLPIFQNVIGIVIEPLMGQVSDRTELRRGTRFPVIFAGVASAGLIFILVSLLAGMTSSPSMRFVIPWLMLLWVASMQVFRGPAFSMLGQITGSLQLPLASSVLTVAGGLVGASGPLLSDIVEKLGPSVTFLIGAAALGVGVFTLQKFSFPPSAPPQAAPADAGLFKLLSVLFLLGLGVGLSEVGLTGRIPALLQESLGSYRVESIAAFIFLGSALTAIPLGIWMGPYQARWGVLWGLGGLLLIYVVALLVKGAVVGWLLILLTGGSLGLLRNNAVPAVLEAAPSGRFSLAVGTFFSGFSVAFLLSSLFAGWPTVIVVGVSVTLCVAAVFLLTILAFEPTAKRAA